MNKFDRVVANASTAVSKQIIEEFKALMADAETLIDATEGNADNAIKAIRSKVFKTLSNAKESIADFEVVLTDKAKSTAKGADHFVHSNPWESIGIAAGLGLMIGLLFRRS